MRTTIAHWTKYSLIACVICTTQVGCKSGWKMPGSGMLPWSKKPSEATLAGSTPSVTVPSSSSPSSSPAGTTGSALAAGSGPASKNTPNLLSSTPKTSPYGGASTVGSKPNNAGAVASANGYQTGPYMTSSGNRPTGYTAPSGYANASSPQLPGASTLPGSNPLPGAGTTAGLASNPPAIPGAPAGLPLPPSPFPASPAGLGTTGTPALASAPAMPNLPATNFPALPSTVPAMPAGVSSAAMPALPPTPAALASMPNGLAPSSTAAPSMPNISGLPTLPNTATTALPAPPATTAAPMYAGAAPYQPGSTARQSSYDFSQPSTSPAGLPGASVPQTANGIPVPGNSVYR